MSDRSVRTYAPNLPRHAGCSARSIARDKINIFAHSRNVLAITCRALAHTRLGRPPPNLSSQGLLTHSRAVEDDDDEGTGTLSGMSPFSFSSAHSASGIATAIHSAHCRASSAERAPGMTLQTAG